MADRKTVRPNGFGRTNDAALIALDDVVVEIKDRDLSRLWFVMSQVMDDVDLTIVRDYLEMRAPHLLGKQPPDSPE